MLVSALSLFDNLSRKPELAQAAESPEYCTENFSVTVDLVSTRVSPSDCYDPEAPIVLMRLAYMLYLLGLFTYVVPPGHILLWVPATLASETGSTGLRFVDELTRRFNLTWELGQFPVTLLITAIVHSLTLLDKRVVGLESGILLNGMRYTIVTSTDYDADSNVQHTTLHMSWQMARVEQCKPESPEFNLEDCKCFAPLCAPISLVHLAEKSTEDEDSEYYYILACMQCGYTVEDTLLRAVCLHGNELSSAHIFSRMLLRPCEARGRNEAIGATGIVLLKTCIDRCTHLSIDALSTINTSKCLLAKRVKRPLLEITGITLHMIQPSAQQPQTHSRPTGQPRTQSHIQSKRTLLYTPKAKLHADGASASNTGSECKKRCSISNNIEPAQEEQMKAILDEIRREFACKSNNTPTPIAMKAQKTRKRRAPKKVAQLADIQESPVTLTKNKGKGKGTGQKPERRVHFNNTVIFVDEWNTVHKIKLQQHEPLLYHQEDDLQQDIQAEFTASLLS